MSTGRLGSIPQGDTVYIYVLELEQGKYYIGKTYNPQFRLTTHFKSPDTSWTIKYKPCRVEKLIPDCDSYDEDKYTLKYMSMHGIQNVRGGSFCQIELSPEQTGQIENMIKGAENKCYNCGSKSHFAKDCIKSAIDSHILAVNDINLNRKIDEYNKIYEYLLYLQTCIKDISSIEVCFEEVRKFGVDTRNQNSPEQHFVIQNSHEQRVRYKISRIRTFYNKYILNQIKKKLSAPWKGQPPCSPTPSIPETLIQETLIKKSPEILVLELINHNCEQRQKLNKIKEKYHSEECVKEVLIKLYMMRIESLGNRQ